MNKSKKETEVVIPYILEEKQIVINTFTLN